MQQVMTGIDDVDVFYFIMFFVFVRVYVSFD